MYSLYIFQNGPDGAGEGGADPALPGVPDQDVQQPPESFQPPPEQFQPPPEQFQPPPEQFEQPPFEEQGFFDQGNTFFFIPGVFTSLFWVGVNWAFINPPFC